MAESLKDRVAVVTGASRGIGRAIALELARAGAHIIALARTQGALEELDDDIKAAGSSATLMSNLGGPAAAVAAQVEIAQRGLAGDAPPRMTAETRARVDSARRALGHLSLASFFALLLGGAAGVLGCNAAYETFRPDRPQPRVTFSIPPGWLPRRPPPPAGT